MYTATDKKSGQFRAKNKLKSWTAAYHDENEYNVTT